MEVEFYQSISFRYRGYANDNEQSPIFWQLEITKNCFVPNNQLSLGILIVIHPILQHRMTNPYPLNSRKVHSKQIK